MNETITEKDILETPMGAFSLTEVDGGLRAEVWDLEFWEERKDSIMRHATRALKRVGHDGIMFSEPEYHGPAVVDGIDTPEGYWVFATYDR